MAVWVDVRKDAMPPLADEVQRAYLIAASVDDRGHIKDAASRGFFLRSLVLDPDDERLLNPQASTVAGSTATQSRTGYYAYAQTRPGDYVNMLRAALIRFQSESRDVATR